MSEPRKYDSYNLHLQFVFGWGDGAGGRAMNPVRADHANEEMRKTYNEGYISGQRDRRKAHREAAERFGVEMSPIRLRR